MKKIKKTIPITIILILLITLTLTGCTTTNDPATELIQDTTTCFIIIIIGIITFILIVAYLIGGRTTVQQQTTIPSNIYPYIHPDIQQQKQNTQIDTIYCPDCGTKNPYSHEHCYKCGKKLTK